MTDVYHCENIEKVCDEFVESAGIQNGDYDVVKNCHYNIPTYWDIGKVYRRLIQKTAECQGIDLIDSLIEIYNSFVSEKIDNYNCAFYYDTTDAQYLSFVEGKVI